MAFFKIFGKKGLTRQIWSSFVSEREGISEGQNYPWNGNSLCQLASCAPCEAGSSFLPLGIPVVERWLDDRICWQSKGQLCSVVWWLSLCLETSKSGPSLTPFARVWPHGLGCGMSWQLLPAGSRGGCVSEATRAEQLWWQRLWFLPLDEQMGFWPHFITWQSKNVTTFLKTCSCHASRKNSSFCQLLPLPCHPELWIRCLEYQSGCSWKGLANADTPLAFLSLRFCLGDQVAPKGGINAYLQAGMAMILQSFPTESTKKSTGRTNLPTINEKLLWFSKKDPQKQVRQTWNVSCRMRNRSFSSGWPPSPKETILRDCSCRASCNNLMPPRTRVKHPPGLRGLGWGWRVVAVLRCWCEIRVSLKPGPFPQSLWVVLVLLQG